MPMVARTANEEVVVRRAREAARVPRPHCRGARDPRRRLPAVLVAPFTTQIRDPTRWPAWVAELGGEPVRLVWVRSDAATLRSRLMARERGRDRGKLADFDAFIERIEPHASPVRYASRSTTATAHPAGATAAASRVTPSAAPLRRRGAAGPIVQVEHLQVHARRTELAEPPHLVYDFLDGAAETVPAQLIGALADRGGASSYLLVVHSTASVWAAL